MTSPYGNYEFPKRGDYLQLVNATGNPTENHTEVEKCTGELGPGLFLVMDFGGGAYACARNELLDDECRRAWIEVITAYA